MDSNISLTNPSLNTGFMKTLLLIMKIFGGIHLPSETSMVVPFTEGIMSILAMLEGLFGFMIGGIAVVHFYN